MPKRGETNRVMACRCIDLADDFYPSTIIASLFGGISLDEVITCLRTSEDENAMVICALYDRLRKPLRSAITLDYLIAAARCKDAHHVASIITDAYTNFKKMESQIIAAQQSPGIMLNRATRARDIDGYADAKLVLQISGAAPVPKNQTNYVIGNKIDNSKNQAVIVAPHNQIVDNVDEILRKLPRVSSGNHKPENPRHTSGEESRDNREHG